jgi:hypothetical protein
MNKTVRNAVIQICRKHTGFAVVQYILRFDGHCVRESFAKVRYQTIEHCALNKFGQHII